MDSQGRASALIGARSAAIRSGLRAVLFTLLVAVGAVSLGGCRNKAEEAPQKAELTKRLDQFRSEIAALQKETSGLRARVDQLPEDLPDLGRVRDDLHAVEEVVGVEDGRSKWLAGELDKAFTSGKKKDIQAVANAIPRSNDVLAQSVVKVMHELMSLERLARQRGYFEALDAAKRAETEDGRRPSKSR
jgi:hypothetical protein